MELWLLEACESLGALPACCLGREPPTAHVSVAAALLGTGVACFAAYAPADAPHFPARTAQAIFTALASHTPLAV